MTDKSYAQWAATTGLELEQEIEGWMQKCEALRAEVERLRAALTEITDLDLEGGEASLADAIVIADEALNPPPA